MSESRRNAAAVIATDTMASSFSMPASKLLKPSATVYVIGNVKEAHLAKATAAFCKWEIICDEKNWLPDNGEPSGQTWTSHTSRPGNKCVWRHPFDLEFRCKSVKDAPKFYVEIYNSSNTSTIDFYGYGVVHLPITNSGKYEISIPIFRPSGSTYDWLSSLLFGGNIRYKNPKQMLLETNSAIAHNKTVSCGNVILEVNILRTGFPNYVDC